MKKAGFLFSLVAALFILGCGQPRTLVSMSISPTSAGVIGPGNTLPQKFTAYGTFTHPSETRDISTEVTWTSSAAWVASVGTDGTVTPSATACGGTVITATAGKDLIGGRSEDSQAIMTATVEFTIYEVNTPGCPAPPSS